MEKPELIKLAVATARLANLDPALVCAIVEQESNWDPWAVRYEPAFDRRYILPMRLRPTLEILRSCSWGLMQVMGETARDNGFGDSPVTLLEPSTGLLIGCHVLSGDMDRAKGVLTDALLRWNGGANPSYADQVLARRANYKAVA